MHPRAWPFGPRRYRTTWSGGKASDLALVALLALTLCLVPAVQAQEAAPRKPAASDVNCESISEAEVLHLASGGTLIDVLRTRIPGLQVQTADWRSRQTSSLGLRGNNSLVGPSEPLIFVDGIRLPQPGGIDYLDLIDPLDVELIEMLPGPAATTLYGTGASSGVILIYTKRGAANASAGANRGRCRP